MNFQIWQCPLEQTFGGFRGYHPELEWKCVWESTLSAEETPTKTLDVLFERFQRIDESRMPPAGYEGRSLTAGDLIRLDDEWYFCAAVGWNLVSPPLGIQSREESQ